MRTVTHREMRNNSAEILRAVAAGETIRVTNHGQLAAVISPPSGSPIEALVASGAARRANRNAASLRTIRRRRATSSSRQILEEIRGTW